MGGRILVIEDDPASSELVSYLLEKSGHTVHCAADGAAGLQKALENRQDLIICDLQMPRLTGYEVIDKLRASPRWRPIPIIALTAYSMPGDREAVLAAGFTEYMTKPLDPDMFVSEIRRFLGGGSR